MKYYRPIVKINIPRPGRKFETIGLLALFLSSISLWWNYHNQQDQNRRWDILNRPNIQITDMSLQKYKSVTYQEVKEIYAYCKPFVYYDKADVYSLDYFLGIYAKSTLRQIYINPNSYTLKDIQSDLMQNHFTKGISGVLIDGFIKPVFNIQNLGQTEASDVRIEISCSKISKDPRDSSYNDFNNDTMNIVFPGKRLFNLTKGVPNIPYFLLRYPINYEILDTIKFRVNVKYKDGNLDDHDHQFHILWTKYDGQFGMMN